MICTGNVIDMQRLNPQAVAREALSGYREQAPLTPRELELVSFALRFCPVPDILARLDADSARHALKRIIESK